jgi:hypothetical protein
MPIMISFSSASYDDDVVFRVEPTARLLRAVADLMQWQTTCGDGAVEFGLDDTAQPVTSEADFITWVHTELQETPSTIQLAHAGECSTIEVELTGHDAAAHCNQVLDAWLAATADRDVEDGEEDDEQEKWEVNDWVVFGDDRVVFNAEPYRGPNAWFTFQTPDM